MIGQRIKQRRLESGLSLTGLAIRAGISRSYLHSLESGTAANPSQKVIGSLAQCLGVAVADLLQSETGTGSAPTDLPPGLAEFANEYDLPTTDVEMLRRLEYRGKQPNTPDDWWYLYESIKRTVK